MKLAQWNRSAAHQAYLDEAYTDIDRARTTGPIRVADTEREPYDGWAELARNVCEVALREAIGDYSDNSKAFISPRARREARDFWLSDDCLWWLKLAGVSTEGLRTVRELIRSLQPSSGG